MTGEVTKVGRRYLPAPVDLPECIREKLMAIDAQRSRVFSMVEHARVAEDAVREFPSCSCVGVGSDHVNVWCCPGSLRDMIPVLRWLRVRGYKTRAITDEEDYGWRTWHLGAISLIASFGSASACRFETVGTKEVPIRKLVCEEVS